MEHDASVSKKSFRINIVDIYTDTEGDKASQ